MEKIKNRALVELDMCGEKVEVASEPIETTPVKVRVTKTQECDFVVIGEKIRYKVEIENECGGDLYNIKFKDELDECCEFVEGSFMVDGHEREPEIIEGAIEYVIEELESCGKVEITFEVIATETCCRGCDVPPPERSTAPTILPILPLYTVTGTGVSGATVYVELPNGDVRQTTVILGYWSVTSPTRLLGGQEVKAWQKEPGKSESEIITRVVG
ncbi:MAG: hypothetical protein FWE45_01365 [Firmicutes bacterium]|nr:hypothetical protein [Bacillota bacterium]